MTKINQSLLALAITASTSSVALAESVAITNVQLHTASAQGVLEDATVVFVDGKISAINPAAVSAETIIDGKGKVLTPGFISTMNTVGLVEVGQEKDSRDTGDERAGMTFDPSLAYNPKSTTIAFARKGGLTTSVVSADGGEDIFAGQTFVAKMSGDWDSVISTHGALFVTLGAEHDGSRAVGMQTLSAKLEETQKALSSANKGEAEEDTELDKEAVVLNAVLASEKALVVQVDRASDIMQLLKLKKQYGIDLVLVGAADAASVAEHIAKADVPVLIDAMRNLPESFDSLHNSLDNAAKLTQAGVKVVLTTGGAHSVYGLRYAAGNAVANGMDYQAALKSVTINAAQVFDIEAGEVAVGKRADLVLWSGDPFEYSTQVEAMWIGGEAQSMQSRLDKLRDRYLTQSDMPRAYSK
ncbi:amidohydrolase [Shewanella maritima]|uniref:Amidohydrolase n=1 Tax=Shewanella maritima TaxID=2520507 RepID=A0A411PI68_9GAMM|nr:amidohydrolase family protein [Shewanella maritima]QBF83082.1 amidohydrolase [Shewanella maritima]